MTEVARIPKAPVPTDGHAIRVMANGTPVAVFRVGESLYALDARCTHVGGPLDQGPVHEAQVTCPWHGSVFDLRNGSVVRGPASRPVGSYRARFDGDTLVLEQG